MKMKRVAVGLLLASIASAACAADMSAPGAPYTKAPAISPAINWSGFYIGAMGGYAAEATSDPLAIKGGFAGGTLGYNWQSGMFVAGIEADGAWADISQTATAGLVTVADKIQSIGTVRGRVGVAFDQVLFYGTGGFAFADNKISASAPGVAVSDSKVHTGWAAGAGVEWMFARGWSVKAEYLYRRFDSQTYFAAQLPPGIVSGSLAMNSGQVGINYHF
jgi:outer membrane immunogenic protein